MVRTDLKDDEVLQVMHYLLKNTVGDKLRHGAIGDAAKMFKVSRWTIMRIRKRAEESKDASNPIEAMKKRYIGRVGRKSIPPDVLCAILKGVPLNLRRTLRTLSAATGLSIGLLQRAKKRGDLVKKNIVVKPALTDDNKLERLEFCLKHIDTSEPTLPYLKMDNIVHIDEKWFYLCRIKNSYYLAKDEPIPYRSVRSKRFISKVMFLTAVARPRYDYKTRKVWDGKVGIWPFTHQVAAQRSSRNRPAGTMETKSLNIDKETFKDYIVGKVIPAIKAKWPGRKKGHIWIQQDNAKPHFGANDPDVLEAGKSDGWNIQMMNQPPNSPDLNVLDLGFFNAIQSLQASRVATKIDDLVEAVLLSYSQISPTLLERNFITLQSVMNKVLEHDGHNNFKIPHLKKESKNRHGTPICRVFCDSTTFKRAQKLITAKK